MDAATRLIVRQRARAMCEYCGLSEAASYHAFHVEHIVAKQHRGSDDLANLAWSCHRCNSLKGPNLSSFDPLTGALVELFNPRRHVWPDHFEMNEAEVIGLTPIGRATTLLLQMNEPERVALRLHWSQHCEDDASSDSS